MMTSDDYRYEEIPPLSHADATTALNSGDPELISHALISIGLHDQDWQWVQQQALRFLDHDHEDVVSSSILALAHTARVNRALDADLAVPALQRISLDPRFSGKVGDALDDIAHFVG